MNKTFATAGRKILKELLVQCTKPQQELFKLMYGRDNNNRSVEDSKAMDINDCVELMDDNKIDWAITQVESTIFKNQINSIR